MPDLKQTSILFRTLHRLMRSHAYGASERLCDFPNKGVKVTPYFIERIVDKNRKCARGARAATGRSGVVPEDVAT